MKPVLSPLRLTDFSVLAANYALVSPETGEAVFALMDNYAVDIDYMIDITGENHRVFVQLEVNKIEQPLPGYTLSAEGVAVFTFEKEAELNHAEKSLFIRYSAVPIAIHSLRMYIATLTSAFPFGKYIFPAIDLEDLMAQKVAQLEALQKGTAPALKGKAKTKVSKAK